MVAGVLLLLPLLLLLLPLPAVAAAALRRQRCFSALVVAAAAGVPLANIENALVNMATVEQCDPGFWCRALW